jgi:hypothetical protein
MGTKTTVIAESKRFKLVQEDAWEGDETWRGDDREAKLHLYFDGVLIANAGCGCCGFCIERNSGVAMIEAMKAGE